MIRLRKDIEVSTTALMIVRSRLSPYRDFYCYRDSGELISSFNLQVMFDRELDRVEQQAILQRRVLIRAKGIKEIEHD
jgi:hypothetical protein